MLTNHTWPARKALACSKVVFKMTCTKTGCIPMGPTCPSQTVGFMHAHLTARGLRAAMRGHLHDGGRPARRHLAHQTLNPESARAAMSRSEIIFMVVGGLRGAISLIKS